VIALRGASEFRRLDKIERFYYLLHPQPTVVVITKCEGGRVNAMPVSWVTPISEEPPTLGVAIDRESYTHECLEKHREATINIPGPQHVDLVYALGSVSGREVDKVERFNLVLIEGSKVSAPLWRDAMAALEVTVYRELDVGECRFYVLKVESAWIREGLFTKYGWNTAKTSPLLHGIGRTFYLVGRQIYARKIEP